MATYKIYETNPVLATIGTIAVIGLLVWLIVRFFDRSVTTTTPFFGTFANPTVVANPTTRVATFPSIFNGTSTRTTNGGSNSNVGSSSSTSVGGI